MKVLDSKKVDQKIKRLAYEIAEQNYAEKTLFILGINNNGYNFAKLLANQVGQIIETKVELSRITLDPANPTQTEIDLEIDPGSLKNKSIIVVDDVANTGRTLFYACKPLMDVLAKKVEVAVLVDRQHKSFPIKVSYVGLSLATTAQEHIEVNLKNKKEQEVLLY